MAEQIEIVVKKFGSRAVGISEKVEGKHFLLFSSEINTAEIQQYRETPTCEMVFEEIDEKKSIVKTIFLLSPEALINFRNLLNEMIKDE